MMNTNDDQADQLEYEKDQGQRASHAYNGYFKAYYKDKCDQLYVRFISAETDEEALQIRGTLQALNEMNDDLLQKIETGELASKQLNSGAPLR